MRFRLPLWRGSSVVDAVAFGAAAALFAHLVGWLNG